MKKILICILFTLIATTYFSCVGYQTSSSYGVGYGVNSGPYGYGSFGYPRVNVGVYSGGYPRYR